MGNMGLLIGKLSITELGKHVLFEGVRIKVVKSVEGCDGCVFDTEEKANGCRFRISCFANSRRDRQSVIFTSGKQKRL